jgi:transposase-like protein
MRCPSISAADVIAIETSQPCRRTLKKTGWMKDSRAVLQLLAVPADTVKEREMVTRPTIFKWRQTEPALILCAVRWYLRYSLSLRDVEELLEERGLEADHTTVWRWVQRYGPELEQRLRRHVKPTNKSWRVDETYLRVKGRWCYLYRALDSAGATIDFLLSALRDADAAKRLFRHALSDRSHPQPRVINTDLAPTYDAAIADIKKEGTLRSRCRHRPVQYLNNIIEQDHRAIKRRVKAKQGFREFQAARRTIQGYEAMNMIRKGQVRWLSGHDVRRQNRFINELLEVAA